jgi:ATP-dependent protease ClpP protease subunit
MKKFIGVIVSLFLFISVVSAEHVFIDKIEIIDKDIRGIIYNYKAFLDKDIAYPEKYRKLIITLLDMKQKDTMLLVIATNGGAIFSAIEVIDAIKKCKGTVKAKIIYAVSAGSLIALSCNEIEVVPYGVMMIHEMSTVFGGKLSAIKNQSKFASKYNDLIIKNIYKNFLTPDEIKRVLGGEEIWLVGDEITKRLKNRNRIK